MKLMISALAALMAISATTFAAEDIESGQAITGTDCVLLGDNVTLNLSNNVIGAYSCTELTSTIKVATCHSSGSRKAGNVKCVVVGENEEGDPIFNASQCTAAGEDIEQAAAYRAYAASNKGGSVGQVALNGSCTSATLKGLGTAYLD